MFLLRIKSILIFCFSPLASQSCLSIFFCSPFHLLLPPPSVPPSPPLVPPPVPSCFPGEQAAACGGEGAFPGFPERRNSDRGGRSLLQRGQELLRGETLSVELCSSSQLSSGDSRRRSEELHLCPSFYCFMSHEDALQMLKN